MATFTLFTQLTGSFLAAIATCRDSCLVIVVVHVPVATALFRRCCAPVLQPGTFCEDVAIHYSNGCCALIQEARETEATVMLVSK